MGSSSNNSAQRAADAAEKQRQAAIVATTGRVNALFDDPKRAQQRADYGAALRDFYVSDANRQKAIADRDLKFALARSGQTGGSLAVDQNQTLGEEYQRGILDADRKVQGGVADLMGRDEQSRLNLLGLAQSGLNTTAAATQAASALRTNLEGANAAARVQGLGDIFESVGQAKKYSEARDEQRRTDEIYARQGMFTPFYSGYGNPGPGG